MSLAAKHTIASDFYVVGGTLRRDAPSYVPRRADDELFRHLASGSLCYVLTSRQMGKSSLMVRTAARLRSEGDSAIVLDLTEVGQNLTVEQWYKGLLGATGEQLALDDDLADVWRLHRDLGPMHRWSRAVCDVVLPRIPGRVVIFVDEIDAVRSLPFSTDEFFAGIRELFNRRSESLELERLTFCLLGVASPSDLIRDTRTTPFNVGHRIELDDFTPDEAAPLARGLGRDVEEGRLLLDRVLYWTGGHPYLTQRLCQAVADDPAVRDPAGIDRLCDDLFLSRRARERDDNLLFVRDRMLRSESDLAELLGLYRRVRSGRCVDDDDANPHISVLKLSGVARVEDGLLRVRNRIYERVFDEAWVRETMPGAEVRRQRRAFTRGFLRAAAVGIVILAIMAYLVSNAWHQRAIAVREQETNRRLLYNAHVNLAYQALEKDDYLRVSELLNEEIPKPGQPDPRGFEFYHLWQRLHRNRATVYAASPSTAVGRIAYSPDGTTIVAGCSDGNVLVCDAETGTVLRTIAGEGDGCNSLAYAPDGSVIAVGRARGTVALYQPATGALVRETYLPHPIMAIAYAPDGRTLAVSTDDDNVVRLLDARTLEPIHTLATMSGRTVTLAFSPDGRRLALGARDGRLRLVDPSLGGDVAPSRKLQTGVRVASYSPDGKTLAVATDDGWVTLFDTATERETAVLVSGAASALGIAFSPDGSRLAVGKVSSAIEVWDVSARKLRSLLPGHGGPVIDVRFSPDGRTLASASEDGTLKLWNAASESPETTLTGHTAAAYCVRFSPDGHYLATASFDGTVGLWDAASGELVRRFDDHEGYIRAVAFSPDGTILASASDCGFVHLREVTTGRVLGVLAGHEAGVFTVAFSPDGRSLASGSFDGTIRVWNVEDKTLRMVLGPKFGKVESLAYSPDGTYIAACGESHSVVLWDAETGQVAGLLDGHIDWVNALTFSPDGTTLVTVGSFLDMTARIWDIGWRQQRLKLKGFAGNSGISANNPVSGYGRANAVAYSPDGRTLAFGTADRTVKLFDALTGQELGTLATHHTLQVYSLAFSPDGSTLATASEDGTVKLWYASTPERVLADAKGN